MRRSQKHIISHRSASLSLWLALSREHRCTCATSVWMCELVMNRTVNCVYFKRQFYFARPAVAENEISLFSFAAALWTKTKKNDNDCHMNESDGHTRNVTVVSITLSNGAIPMDKSTCVERMDSTRESVFVCRQICCRTRMRASVTIFVWQCVSVNQHRWQFEIENHGLRFIGKRCSHRRTHHFGSHTAVKIVLLMGLPQSMRECSLQPNAAAAFELKEKKWVEKIANTTPKSVPLIASFRH